MKDLIFMIVVAQTSASIFAIPTPETCPEIPGWKIRGGNHEQNFGVSDDDARTNQNNLTLHTCCAYKNKCKFKLFQQDKGGKDERCIPINSCSNLTQNGLRLERKGLDERMYGQTPYGTKYCTNFYNEFTGNMEFCTAAEMCFIQESTKSSLLSCLQTYTSFVNYGGFFDENIMFPYELFQFITRNTSTMTDVVYELKQDGNIDKRIIQDSKMKWITI